MAWRGVMRGAMRGARAPSPSARRLSLIFPRDRDARYRARTDPQSYLTYLKGYMKAVKAKLQETNPDRVATFEKAAAGFAKKVVTNFKDYEFYTGESMDTDGMVALLNYREDGTTPCKFQCDVGVPRDPTQSRERCCDST